MNSSVAQVLLALISIIATLIGGTGTAIGFKNKNKSKSLERQLEELYTNIKNQRDINADLKRGIDKLDSKIDDIKDILINSKKVVRSNA